MTLLAFSVELARPMWLLVLLAAPVFVWLTLRTASGNLRATAVHAIADRRHADATDPLRELLSRDLDLEGNSARMGDQKCAGAKNPFIYYGIR